MTELLPMEIDDEEELRKAAVVLAAATADPAMVAAENARLRSSIRGSYALLHIAIRRLGGDVRIPASEYRAIPPIERLRTELDEDTGDVRLVVDTAGRRRKKR